LFYLGASLSHENHHPPHAAHTSQTTDPLYIIGPESAAFTSIGNPNAKIISSTGAKYGQE